MRISNINGTMLNDWRSLYLTGQQTPPLSP
jgi:hypothetical protein